MFNFICDVAFVFAFILGAVVFFGGVIGWASTTVILLLHSSWWFVGSVFATILWIAVGFVVKERING